MDALLREALAELDALDDEDGKGGSSATATATAAPGRPSAPAYAQEPISNTITHGTATAKQSDVAHKTEPLATSSAEAAVDCTLSQRDATGALSPEESPALGTAAVQVGDEVDEVTRQRMGELDLDVDAHSAPQCAGLASSEGAELSRTAAGHVPPGFTGGGLPAMTPDAADSSEDDGASSDMEATLAALARSAENLTRASGGNDEEGADACLELLKHLGDGLGDLGANMGFGEDAGEPTAAGGGGGGEVNDTAFDGLLDSLVGQLLSKDVMVEPLKMLHDEFPRYLRANGQSLSTQDVHRYTKQQEIVGRILQAYEERPEDTDHVARLMQEMQLYGPPPAEMAAPGAACVLS